MARQQAGLRLGPQPHHGATVVAVPLLLQHVAGAVQRAQQVGARRGDQEDGDLLPRHEALHHRIAAVANDARYVHGMLERITDMIEREPRVQLVVYRTEVL